MSNTTYYLDDGRAYHIYKKDRNKHMTCIECGRKTNILVHDLCPFCVDAELTRLYNENLQIHTMVECATCKRGVRSRNSVCGMCPECAEKRINSLEFICGLREVECKDQRERIAEQNKEIIELKKRAAILADLEEAMTDGYGREMWTSYRIMANALSEDGYSWFPGKLEKLADVAQKYHIGTNK